MFFKKKKIYTVEYRDAWNDYGCVVVKATDRANAWKKARRQFWLGSVFAPTVCLCITEVKDA